VTADESWFAPTLDASSTLLGGRYAVLGVLGAGAMGSVFKVRDLELDEVVALKMLRGDFSDPAMLARFRAEVKLARRVTHRNVARSTWRSSSSPRCAAATRACGSRRARST